MIWTFPPPQSIRKDPKADDPTHGLSMASRLVFLLPAQTSWPSQAQLGERAVLSMCESDFLVLLFLNRFQN